MTNDWKKEINKKTKINYNQFVNSQSSIAEKYYELQIKQKQFQF